MDIKKRTFHLTIAIVSFLVSFFFSAGYDEAITEHWHYGSSNIEEPYILCTETGFSICS